MRVADSEFPATICANMLSSMRLFHFIPQALWSALHGPAYAPPSLVAEGFIHLSAEHQLAGTLETHFADTAKLLLLELDPKRLGADLRMEVSRGGDEFPHLYRALEAADLLHGWHLRAGPE